jgi:uncharacterized protein
MRILWFVLGSTASLLALIGVFLPILPTVPFLILAAFAFARSSQRLHRWIVTHPIYGPPVVDWQEKGAISRRAKWFACVSMIGGIGVAATLGLPAWVLAAQGLVMLSVAGFVVTRPE